MNKKKIIKYSFLFQMFDSFFSLKIIIYCKWNTDYINSLGVLIFDDNLFLDII